MANKIDVSFYNEGIRVSTKTFTVGEDGTIPLPADCLFAFKNSEIRIRANKEEQLGSTDDADEQAAH